MEIDVPTEYLRGLETLYNEWRGRYSL